MKGYKGKVCAKGGKLVVPDLRTRRQLPEEDAEDWGRPPPAARRGPYDQGYDYDSPGKGPPAKGRSYRDDFEAKGKNYKDEFEVKGKNYRDELQAKGKSYRDEFEAKGKHHREEFRAPPHYSKVSVQIYPESEAKGKAYRDNYEAKGKGYREDFEAKGNSYRDNFEAKGKGYRDEFEAKGKGYRDDFDQKGKGKIEQGDYGGTALSDLIYMASLLASWYGYPPGYEDNIGAESAWNEERFNGCEKGGGKKGTGASIYTRARDPEAAGKAGKERTLFVGSLPKNVTEDMVRESFEIFGELTAVKMMLDESGKSKGYCFIEFMEMESVEEVLGNHEHNMVDGKWVDCKPSSGGSSSGSGGGGGKPGDWTSPPARRGGGTIRAAPY